jgi:phosphoribosyl-ATP pyrophosphohydrolase/phosphoribosyl-AMP cyclohydrolase
MISAIEDVKFDEKGLIAAVIQDARTHEVLTLAWMNRESLAKTLDEKETWFWSRSRSELWHKGATSGNTQKVVDIRLDCDLDALIVEVIPAGPACHTGEISCFHNRLADLERVPADHVPGSLGNVLDGLYELIETRKSERPEGSYTTYLFEKGLDKILKKIGEESAETIIAAKNSSDHELVSETSDLLYHLLVLLVERGISLEYISQELKSRSGSSKEQ